MTRTTQRAIRTETLLSLFRGNNDEFTMLKGVLCASHGLTGAANKRYAELFDSHLIAVRMDALNADSIANFKRAA